MVMHCRLGVISGCPKYILLIPCLYGGMRKEGMLGGRARHAGEEDEIEIQKIEGRGREWIWEPQALAEKQDLSSFKG